MKFTIVEMPKEIVLVPISKNPLSELEKIGEKAGINKYTLSELKKMAKEGAEREVLSSLENKYP